jgi:hypothetical protein
MTTIAQTHHVSSDILAFLAASIENGDTEDDHETSGECNEEFEDIWIAQAAAAFGGGDAGSRSSKTKPTRSEEGDDNNEEASQHVIHTDEHGKILAFGVPAVPQTTLVSLKHDETRGADDEDAHTCSTRSCSSSGHSSAHTSRTTSSSSQRLSFNEAVTVNHMENFRYILPKRERYALWYSDIENIRMQLDYMNEKVQAAQRDADDNGRGTTTPQAAATTTATTNKDKTSMLTKTLKQKKTGFYPPGLFALTKNKAKSFTRKIFEFNDGRFAAPPPQHAEVLPSSLHGHRTVTNRAA